MSLLNQVLQDLDERGGLSARKPLRVAAASVDHLPVYDRDPWYEWPWLRYGGVGLALLLLTAVAWQISESMGSSATLQKEVHEAAASGSAIAAAAEVPAPKRFRFHVYEVDPPATFAVAAADRASKPAEVEYLPLKNTQVAAAPAARRSSVKSTRSSRPATSKITPVAVAQPMVSLDGVREAIGAGQAERAHGLLRQLLDQAPAHQAGRELMVGLLLRDGQQEAALAELDLALQHHPESIKFLLIKARLLAQSEQTLAAIHLLENAPVHRGSIEALQMLGALNQQQGRYSAAIEAYEALLEVAPNSGSARVGLAISLDSQGDARALDYYRQALDLGGLPRAAAAYAEQRRQLLESQGG